MLASSFCASAGQLGGFFHCWDKLMPLMYRDKGTTGTQLAIYSHELCIGTSAKSSWAS